MAIELWETKIHQKLFTPGIPVFDSKDFWFPVIIDLAITEDSGSRNQAPTEPRSVRGYPITRKNVYGLGRMPENLTL